MEKQVRCAGKAVIIQNRKLLTLKKEDHEGYLYTLPGGGQEHGETARAGIIRECIEEISVKVKPGRILFIRDYIGRNHGIEADAEKDIHQLELMFLCEITEGVPENGPVPDNNQICVEWLDLDKIEKYRLYPAAIKQYLKEPEKITATIYLGDVN